MTIEQIKELKTVEFFEVLSHEIRVKIISLLYEKIEMSYTEILHVLDIEEGNLNFHLRKMKGFLELTEKKTYRLSEYGTIAYGMLRDVAADTGTLHNASQHCTSRSLYAGADLRSGI